MALWIKFDWDPQKEKTNYEKHGILFSQAVEAFADPERLIEYDAEHSIIEERYYCYGKVGERVMTVRFTPREDHFRIFGAAYWREGRKNMTHDDGYEDNPWADDPPGKLVPVSDSFLPPADVIRRSIAQVSGNGMVLFSLPPEDIKNLEIKAKVSGVNPSDLITLVLDDYVTGQLVKRT